MKLRFLSTKPAECTAGDLKMGCCAAGELKIQIIAPQAQNWGYLVGVCIAWYRLSYHDLGLKTQVDLASGQT